MLWWKIFKKAGYDPELSISTVVPIANIVMLFFLAFAKWPLQERVENPGEDKPQGKKINGCLIAAIFVSM